MPRMDARALAATALLVAVCPAVAVSATHRTDNFVVTAPTQAFAKQVGEAAEYYRHHLAIAWLGKPLPGKWSQPCPIKCKVGRIGAGGATSFTFNEGEVFGWHMDIQGSEQRILDSVLPHEISHMIFACHFRRQLPRWADEGAATLVEHESERMRQTKLLNQVIKTSKRIPLSKLLSIKEYPRDMQDVLTLYAEGYSLADYLVQKKGEQGRAEFLAFLGDALEQGWERSFQSHYGIASINEIEQEWQGWVMAGSPALETPDDTLLASNDDSRPLPNRTDDAQVRGQSPKRMEIVSNPSPLPRLSRPRRQRTASADLAAPQPGSLAMAEASEPKAAPVSAPPVSVHPARIASPPDAKPKWSFPWQKRATEPKSVAGGASGFSDPGWGARAPEQQPVDFSR